jgi:hypothetical protein
VRNKTAAEQYFNKSEQNSLHRFCPNDLFSSGFQERKKRQQQKIYNPTTRGQSYKTQKI